ncbi:isoprenylcysteine carboxylmethyltransferase family protein [Desulfosporosinus sp. FKB]|uniref:methyltransferase family protein n=1 Tax=Desulfosporosinus sp. FKB TaxID=1969835 RepID=UPI001482298F|nr:isoprenylcysteine carboxylmethyltransferase family protein [Desulfosporosinus sp. FKB]
MITTQEPYTVNNQKIILNGPYHIIRHPGYLSSICIWIGTALALNNWVLTVTFTPLFFTIYIYRIFAEETMLIKEFGQDYKGYMKKTWRLIPFVF